MSNPRVAVLQRNQIRPDKSTGSEGSHGDVEGSRVDVQAGAYLPSIYGDQNNSGGGGGSEGGDPEQIVQFFQGASTGQLKAVGKAAVDQASKVDAPLAPVGSQLAFLEGQSHYAPKSLMETNRRNYGDYSLPIPGMKPVVAHNLPQDSAARPIVFDANDAPFNANKDPKIIAASSSIDEEHIKQLTFGATDARLNRMNKSRIPMYQMTGVALRA